MRTAAGNGSYDLRRIQNRPSQPWDTNQGCGDAGGGSLHGGAPRAGQNDNHARGGACDALPQNKSKKRLQAALRCIKNQPTKMKKTATVFSTLCHIWRSLESCRRDLAIFGRAALPEISARRMLRRRALSLTLCTL